MLTYWFTQIPGTIFEVEHRLHKTSPGLISNGLGHAEDLSKLFLVFSVLQADSNRKSHESILSFINTSYGRFLVTNFSFLSFNVRDQ